MNIIKRNGSEAIFDGQKIKACLKKANASVPAENRITDGMIDGIVSGVTGNSAHRSGYSPRDGHIFVFLDALRDYILQKSFIILRFRKYPP